MPSERTSLKRSSARAATADPPKGVGKKALLSTVSVTERRRTTPALGAHVNGGLKSSVAKALEIGAQAMQIFIGSPQMWREPSPAQQEVQNFISGVRDNDLGPVFVHGNYLVNLASASEENLRKSIDNLRTALFLADMVGSEGLIFHPGSAGQQSYKEALRKVVHALEAVLDGYSGKCRLLLEVCAGQGQTLGDKFCEFADIIDALARDKRLGVCWDTCHLFNAGYDVSSAAGLRRTMDEFAEQVGFEWLCAIHANDSKTPLGARRDRHENIGAGCIGEEAFGRMLKQSELRAVPWILEVPGMERKGPDRPNMNLLKKLAGVPVSTVK